MQRWIASFVLMFSSLAAAQERPRPATEPLASGTTAIVVDVVVHDNRGNPVADLRKEDFRLLENGVAQEIADVTIVGGPASAAPAAGGRSGARAAPAIAGGLDTAHRRPAFLALVFDRLSLDARARAVKGALGLVETLTPDDFVAVYVIDLSLETVQTYTNDRARLRRALDDVARRASTLFDRDATRKIGESVKALGDADPSVPVVASAESGGRPVDTRGLGGGSVVPDAASIQTGLAWEAMARDQQGYATTHALLAVTTGLGRVPGRKSVVFFAEGLAIPDAVLPHFKDVVTTANRGNVSVYTIDGAGLRVHSEDAVTGRAVRAMGAEGLAINPDGSNRSDLRMLERNEDVLRLDPRTSLRLLADQTGGFLIEGTNDLRPGLRRIEADRRFYYVLTYPPSNRNLDGTWRSITVQVPNRRVTIRARSGYLAVDSRGLLPLLAYEGPTLAALGRADAPADLPLRAAAFVFPSAGPSRLAVLAATSAPALRFETDANGKFRADFTILVRIVNARGEVVRKASQPYRLSGAAEQLQAARRGEILFFRQPALEPGTYTLEAALHDALASLSAVHRSTFEVPASEPGRLQVSSLLLVRRAERVKPDERDKDNPLYMGDVLLYPNLGEPLQKSRDKAATFYFVATVPSGPAPRAEIEIVQDGRTVARAPAPLPAPGSSGRIEHVIQLPLEPLLAGAYTVRLTVIADRARETSEATMTIVD